MTYNVEVWNTDDDSEGNDKGWESRDPATAVQTVVDADPDIVGFQEDGDDWNSYLATLTTKGYSRFSTGGNGWENLDIFYKTNKFNLISSGLKFYKKLADEYTSVPSNGADMSLDQNGDGKGFLWWEGDPKGRMLSYVVLEDKSTGAIFLVVNTHLHYGSTSASATEHHLLREYQARLLRAWLEDMETQYSNQIVMGDLNADPAYSGTAAINELTGNDGLSLAKDTAYVKGDVGGTIASTSTYLTRDIYVFDHILYQNMTAVEYYVVNNMVDADNTRYPSDHLPVMARLICYAE